MTHTPGPWRVHSEHADRIIVNGCCVYQVGNLAVPDSYEPGVMGEPNPNDVRLMAAAPALLRAVLLAQEWSECDGYPDDNDMVSPAERAFREAARAAIATAEGRE